MLSSIEYQNIKEESVQGRYVVMEQIELILGRLPEEFTIEEIGYSVKNKSIKSVTVGSGSRKILMWSQMHGNESTTTKAVLDLLNFLQQDTQEVVEIKNKCTIKIIPILNPDGAFAYTRINANEVDLNRDAQNRSQPESVVLRKVYDSFKPNYCLNLHDQRTIFNVGNTNKPATVSFLAPAHDSERNISKSRAISMQLIVAMNEELQKVIPGQVGRYDDGFNSNCVGDAFQMLNTPTILFESGHYPEDYQREQTRKYIFISLVKVLVVISSNSVQEYKLKEYSKIPENGKLFFDILILNTEKLNSHIKTKKDIGILFKETLKGTNLEFVPYIDKMGDLKNNFFGHKTYDCEKEEELMNLNKLPFIDEILKNIV
ncbi:M14 metallopeptidase family protein [uncultured Maribacter sp.]|uniref:M14 family metallopeptidase n=1 Tax=uncultured Maribacter sp. TaxID=431308 RepID=UPI002629C5A2|nr:M14 metallopeptidase family protein [uncultured Maribacter sp.]